MPQEIERKFLVNDASWRASADSGRRLAQAYLAETDVAVVRVRIDQAHGGRLTVKSAEPGLSRREFEYPIPLDDAAALLELRQGAVLEKIRHRVPHGGRVWEVDVYGAGNAGLVIAEIELDSETASVDLPPWVGREVTGEARYYAARLAQRPFRSWREPESG